MSNSCILLCSFTFTCTRRIKFQRYPTAASYYVLFLLFFVGTCQFLHFRACRKIHIPDPTAGSSCFNSAAMRLYPRGKIWCVFVYVKIALSQWCWCLAMPQQWQTAYVCIRWFDHVSPYVLTSVSHMEWRTDLLVSVGFSSSACVIVRFFHPHTLPKTYVKWIDYMSQLDPRVLKGLRDYHAGKPTADWFAVSPCFRFILSSIPRFNYREFCPFYRFLAKQ